MTSISSFNSWIFASRPNPQARLRLFCFPHAGGGASFFRPWIGMLPPDIEVCPVQLPGRENRLKERPFNQFSPLISRHLFISAYRAPQIPITESPLHQLSDAEFVKKVLSFNGTKREVLENDELRQFLLPILRADFAVCETYVHTPEAPLSSPITVFGGLQDHRVKREALAAWQEQTSDRFIVRMLPGDHFFLQNPRGLLLQLLSQQLAQLAATSVPSTVAAY